MYFLSAAHGPRAPQLSGSIFQHAEASISLHLPGTLPTFSFITNISQHCMASAHTRTHARRHTHTHTRSWSQKHRYHRFVFFLPGEITHNNKSSEMWPHRFRICLNSLCKNLHSPYHLTHAPVNNRSVLLTGTHKVRTFNMHSRASQGPEKQSLNCVFT